MNGNQHAGLHCFSNTPSLWPTFLMRMTMKTKPSIHFNFSPTGTQQLEPHSYLHMYNNLFLVNGFREGNGTPLQYSFLENPMDGGAWWAAVHGVTKSWTRLSDFTFTFHFHALEKEMAAHSSVLAWRIPGMGEPGGLPSVGSHRVGHDCNDIAAAAVVCMLTCVFSTYNDNHSRQTQPPLDLTFP